MQILEPQTEGKLKFVLSDADKKVAKGRPVLINKAYRFDENGELVVSAKDAAKMQRILCRYFGCKLVALDGRGEELSVSGDSTLVAAKVVSEPQKSAAPASASPPKSESGPKQPAPVK